MDPLLSYDPKRADTAPHRYSRPRVPPPVFELEHALDSI